jgi:hypothetical protein
MMTNRFSTSVTPLDDRIRALRAEIDGIIIARADELAEAHPNIPTDVLRNILRNRAGDCQCRAYLRLQEQSC